MSSDESRRALMALRAQSTEAKTLFNKFAGEPAAIDFGAYKSRVKFSGAAVDALQKQAAETKLAEQTFAVTAEEKAKRESLRTLVNDTVEASKEELSLLKSELQSWEQNSITLDTTTAELLNRHPGLAKEIEQEIKNHQWGKDV